MAYSGDGRGGGPPLRGHNDGNFFGAEGLRITVANSEAQQSRFGVDRNPRPRNDGRAYFDQPESSGFLGGNRQMSDRIAGNESLRVTVGNDNFLSDHQRDPPSRRLGPPVNERERDPWGVNEFSAEERFRQGQGQNPADMLFRKDVSPFGNQVNVGSPSGRFPYGRSLDPFATENRPATESPKVQSSLQTQIASVLGMFEPRQEPKPLKSALKSCLKKPSSDKQPVTSSTDVFPSYGQNKDSFSDYGFKQADQRLNDQKFGLNLGFGSQPPIKSAVEDEDRFLYGDEEEPKPKVSKVPGMGLPFASAPEPEVRSQTFPIPIPGREDNFKRDSFSDFDRAQLLANARKAVESKPVKAEVKKEDSGLPNDPTIANILKSIGFDFEMSRKMQERAKQEQEDLEKLRNAKKRKPKVPSPTDLGSFGINTNASFLGGGLASIDLKSALDVQKEKPYAGSQFQSEALRPSVVDSSMFKDELSSFIDEARRSKHDERRSSLEEEFRRRNDIPLQYEKSPNTSGRLSYGIQPERPRTGETPSPRGHPNEDIYRRPSPASRYRFDKEEPSEERYMQRSEGIRAFKEESYPQDSQPFDRSMRGRSPPSRQFTDKFDNNSRMPPSKSFSELEGTVPLKRSRDQESDVWHRLGVGEDWFEGVKPPSRSKNLEVSVDMKSNRTVLPPKMEHSEEVEVRRVISKEKEPVPTLTPDERKKFHKEMNERRKRLSVLENEMERLRKQQNELMRKKQREKGGHKDPLLMENSKLQDAIAEQISVLRKAADENEKMLQVTATDRAFSIKDKAEGVLERDHGSRGRGRDDGRLEHRGQEDSSRERNSRDRHSHERSSRDRNSHERSSRERSVSERGSKDYKSPRSESRASSKAGDQRESRDRSQSNDKGPFEKSFKEKGEGKQLRKPGGSKSRESGNASTEKKPKEKAEVSKSGISIKWNIHYEYYDPGNHWCKDCNLVLTNVYDVFDHVHCKKHKQSVNQYDRPWMPEDMKTPDTGSQQKRGQTAVAAMRGVEFMMGVKAFYCRLCKTFSGDAMCAEQHLKTNEHNEKYRKYLEENPFYEKRFNLDKAAGVSSIKKEEVSSDKRKVEDHSKAISKKPRWVEDSDSEENEEDVKPELTKRKRGSRFSVPTVPDEQKTVETSQPKVKKEEASNKFGFKLTGKVTSTPNWIMLQKSKGQTTSAKSQSTTSTSTSAIRPVIGPAFPLRKNKPTLQPAKVEADARSKGSDRKSPASLDMFLTIADKTETSKSLPVLKESKVPQESIATAFGSVAQSSALPKEPAPALKPIATPSAKPHPPPPTVSKLPAVDNIPLPPVTIAKTKEQLETEDTEDDLKLLGIDPESLKPDHRPVPPPQLTIGSSGSDAYIREEDNMDDGASSGSGISMEMGSDFEVLDECEED